MLAHTPPLHNLNLFPDRGLTDPHVLIENGRIYLYCGHDESWHTESTWRMDRWEIWSTDDLQKWRHEANILPEQTYFGSEPNCWGGDIACRNGRYYWYFSNRNTDTGVLVAPTPTGPFHDPLGKPLLPNGIIPGHPYDPEVFEEDGTHTIVFGAGVYYAATLADDMVSLAEEPAPIRVLNADGTTKRTDDKPCVFQRDGLHYLVWGGNYAMSSHLRGPYEYKGDFLTGGHGAVFEWQGQWYAVQENKDISLFYRGVSLKPVFFNPDGTILVPADDTGFPAHGRVWDFARSPMGWHACSGTTLDWTSEGTIRGEVSGHAVLESSIWLLTELAPCSALRLRLRNRTAASQARISLATHVRRPGCWRETGIDWNSEASATLEIAPDSDDFVEYNLDLGTLTLASHLKRLRIEPALGASSGSWEIDCIRIQ